MLNMLLYMCMYVYLCIHRCVYIYINTNIHLHIGCWNVEYVAVYVYAYVALQSRVVLYVVGLGCLQLSLVL